MLPENILCFFKLPVLTQLIFMLLSAPVITLGQPVGNVGVSSDQRVAPGPSGVLIFLVDSVAAAQRHEVQYVVSRKDRRDRSFKTLTTLSFPATVEELQSRLGEATLREIVRQQKLESAEFLFTSLKQGNYNVLGLYATSPEVMQALGWLYIDKEVRGRNATSDYRLEASHKDVKRLVFAKSLKDVRYSPFPTLKKYSTTVGDSSLMITWYAVNGAAAFAEVFSFVDGTAPKGSGERAFVYSRNDTLFATFSQHTRKGDRLSLFIRPADFAGNTGTPSDTVNVLSLSFDKTFTIEDLKAYDTLGAIKLGWKPLPRQAWFTGIRVLKSRSALDDYIVVDTLPTTASHWIDRKIIHGVQYYYIVEPIVYELPQRTSVTPARTTMSAKPLPRAVMAPQGVKLSFTANRDVRISWMANSELGMFGYYVMRGTSRENLRVVSQLVRDTVYVDSTKLLQPGVSYVYAVLATDVEMQESDTSALVSAIPLPGKPVAPPGGLAARFTETGVRLHWNDVSRLDASVVGYIVFKRKKGDEYFTPLTKVPIRGTFFKDSTINDPGVFEYGCASVDSWNNQSILSPTAEVEIPGTTYFYPPTTFNVRNLQAGIEVSLPTIGTDGNDRKYVIYRRVVGLKSAWEKVAEIPVSNDALFIDKKVSPSQLYGYTVSIKGPTGESTKSNEKTIRRN